MNGRRASPPAATFDDEGVRGSVAVEERPGFSRMLDFLKASKAGTYAVRFYDTSRMGRFLDPEEHFVAERFLRRAGARSVAYTKGAYTEKRSIANSVLKAVESHANRAYSEKLSRDVHRGLMTRVREGKRSGGVPPWGYDLEYPDYDGKPYARVRYLPVGSGAHMWAKEVTYLEDGRREVIPAEYRFVSKVKPVRSRLVPSAPERVEAVRLIFEEYLKGTGLRRVARRLQEESFPSPQGDEWTVPGVRSILMNPAYCGKACYGRRSESKYHALEAGGVVRERDEGEAVAKKQMHIADEKRWVVTDEEHEHLVSEENWRAAQALRKSRDAGTGGRSHGRTYLLSGHLFCPRCGHNYTGHTTKNGRGCVTSNYICGNYERGGVCTRGPISREAAEEAILDLVTERLLASRPPAELREAVRKVLATAAGAVQKQQPDPRATELEAVEKEIKGIVEHVSSENLALFDGRLSRLRERRDALRAELVTPPSGGMPAAPAFDLEEAVEAAVGLATRLRDLLARGNLQEEDLLDLRENVVPAVVKRIEVRENNVLRAEVYRVPIVVGSCGRGEWI